MRAAAGVALNWMGIVAAAWTALCISSNLAEMYATRGHYPHVEFLSLAEFGRVIAVALALGAAAGAVVFGAALLIGRRASLWGSDLTPLGVAVAGLVTGAVLSIPLDAIAIMNPNPIHDGGF